MFLIFLFLFFIIGTLIGAAGGENGEALILIFGAIVVLIMFVHTEKNKMLTPEGREQNEKELEEEKRIEENFGIVDYFDDKKDK